MKLFVHHRWAGGRPKRYALPKRSARICELVNPFVGENLNGTVEVLPVSDQLTLAQHLSLAVISPFCFYSF